MILIRTKKDFDFEMAYFNSDGMPGSLCGNGGRCAVAFAHSLGIIKEHTSFIAFDGEHKANIIQTNPYIVKLQMKDVDQIETNATFTFLDTGSPHYISFRDNIDSIDIVNEGRKIRYNDRFKKDGTNVNFVEIKEGELYIRTYERGVENETLSCGTGITAAVLAASFTGKINSDSCLVNTPGGKLTVFFKKNGDRFSDIWLEGPASMVFKGELI